jgi:ABC-type amino acid transport substrate-binding protein
MLHCIALTSTPARRRQKHVTGSKPAVGSHSVLLTRHKNKGKCLRHGPWAASVANELASTGGTSGVTFDGPLTWAWSQVAVAQEVAAVAASSGVQIDGPPTWTLDQVAGMAFGVRGWLVDTAVVRVAVLRCLKSSISCSLKI